MARPLDNFISELGHLNVKLWLDGDNLRYKAPKGTLSATLLAQLRERKAEILTFLRHADATSHSDHTPIKPVARKADLPLSFAQQRLWFLTQLDPDSSAYNLPRAYRLTGILNVSALEHSLCEIVRRHESLRTTFREVGGQPSQVITPNISLTLPLINLQKLPLDQRQAIAERKVIEEVQQPFDLTQGPLLRAKLCNCLQRSMCCCWLCITSFPMVGLLIFSSRNSLLSMMPFLTTKPLLYLHCRFNMLTMPSGNANGCKERFWSLNSTIGNNN